MFRSERSDTGLHPLLFSATACVLPAVIGALGLQVSNLSFKLALEDDLIQSMLGMSPEGSITGDSLARVLQLFGPCMQLSMGTAAVPKAVTGAGAAAADGTAESEAGVLLNTGEVCNAQIAAAHIGYSSLVPSPDLSALVCSCWPAARWLLRWVWWQWRQKHVH